MRLFLRFWAFITVFLSVASVWAMDPWVAVEDVRAGDEVPVQITGLLASESVEVTLVRPAQPEVKTRFTANDKGSVFGALPGLHVRAAGEYQLNLQRTVNNTIIKDDFLVVAGAVSPYRSLLHADTNAQAADGESEFLFEVRAYDTFGNPIANAPVRAFSTRNQDQIIIQPRTNNLGRASGRIVSSQPGVSTISAMVGETLIQDKKEVIFHVPTDGLPAVGQGLGDFLRAQIFDDQDSVGLGYFEIENLPGSVNEGEFVGMRVVAYDTNGQLFTDYDGSVEFASTDDDIELPNEYSFVNEDQGAHDFSLAVRFGSPGDHTLTVRDTIETAKIGETAVRVLPSNSTNPEPPVTEIGNIVINTPQNSGTYKTKRLTVTGSAPGLSVLQVRFGKAPAYQVATESLEVQSDGSFAYQTPTLIEGYHELSIASLDNEVESNVVAFTIDASAPESMKVSIDPEGNKEPGDIFNINLESSESLALVQCVFNEALYELALSGENTYSAQVGAPAQCGEYPVGCTISDQVGNQFEEPNATVVKVCGETPIDLPVDPPVVGNTPPTPPTNTFGEPTENRVTLFWSPSTDDGEVVQYRVNYLKEGTSEIQENRVPDNRTQWYVDNLEACVKYRFTVMAIDNEGVSSIPSEVVEQAPFCPEELQPSPPINTESGGNFPWIVMALSLIVGGTVVSLFRRA